MLYLRAIARTAILAEQQFIVRSSALFAKDGLPPATTRRSYAAESSASKATINRLSQLLNDADKQKLRYIENEITIAYLEGSAPNPDEVSLEAYQYLLTLSNNQRQTYYRYLTKAIGSTKNQMLKRQVHDQMRAHTNLDTKPRNADTLFDSTAADQHLTYSVNNITLFPRFRTQITSRWQNLKLARHMWSAEPTIIFDCGFERQMTHHECKDTAKQLFYAMIANRSHLNPFLMHLYNLDPNGMMYAKLLHHFPAMAETNLPAYLHAADYTNELPKEKLVILTNDSPHVLHKFDAGVTYVLGAIVDRSPKGPCMLSRAKQLNIQTARLPFDAYRRFHMRKKIPLNSYMEIMLEARMSGNWDTAFNCLSCRYFR